MLDDDEKKALRTRFARAEGQVRGIVRMIDEDAYCLDVMNQIAAVQSALAGAAKELLSRHLDTCVRSAMESGRRADRERVLDELQDLFARYGRATPKGSRPRKS